MARKYSRQSEQHTQRPWGGPEQGLFKNLREDSRNEESGGKIGLGGLYPKGKVRGRPIAKH